MKLIFGIFLVVILTVWTVLRLTSEINYPAVRWDEQTNINVIKETGERKSFPVLYYKNQPFFQKPPLWYWLNYPFISEEKLQVLRFRLVSIISAVLIISITVIFVLKNFGLISGTITWIILLFSHQLFAKNPGDYFSSHTLVTADLDSLQVLFILISFILLQSKKKSGQIVAGVVTGFAVLTKGPGGFIPLIGLLLLRKDLKTPLLVSLLTITPWYFFMLMNYGRDFIDSHIGHHLIQRTVSSLDGHHNPPWYYLQILTDPRIYPLFPLVLLAVVLFKQLSSIPFVIRYCGLTAVLLLIIPSLIGTRLAWYILPLYPFLAMFTGIVLGRIAVKKFGKII